MAITAAQVNELRKRTGISMMQCKKALEETGGDEEKAIDILRKKGAAKAAEKSERETSEGIIVTKVDETSYIGNIIDVADKYKKPIAYFTNGQEVPNDIFVAEPDNIINMIVGGVNEYLGG